MDGGKVGGQSTCAQSCGNSDGQRDANSLPEDGAASSSHGVAAIDSDAQRPKLATEDGPGTSRAPEQTAPKRPRSPDTYGCSSLKKVRLEEYVPASQVIDHELRDRCEVKLTWQTSARAPFKSASATMAECWAWAYARYASEEEAAAAAQALQGTVLEGARIKVSYCGEKWKDPARRPRYLPDTLDVQRLPSNSMTVAKVAAIFPTGRVLMVTNTGHAKVKFGSTEELIAAVRKPQCHVVGGKKLKFAIAITSRPAGLEKEDDGGSEEKNSDDFAEDAPRRDALSRSSALSFTR
ncbi:hypothetical protein HPB52_006823 [Rhipicephalus sanguineus]|uniref:Uncharacterized protein n=1 Tax=Rhipicephalus sanguineus TaxID=34632 RepID=A0A9D4QCW3_RHISA|nr:hypothetical protein HPB52_006823 [Rhipicephalus sanguineus]